MRDNIKIDCYLSLSCGSEDNLRRNICRALEREKIKAEVNFVYVGKEEALRLGLRGSPSIRINGEDIQPAQETGFS